HDHRDAGLDLFARHLHAVGRVRVDQHAKTLPGRAYRREAVSVRALAADEAVLPAGGGKCRIAAQIEDAGLSELLAEQRAHARAVTAEQVVDETLEIARLGDV